MSNVEVPLLNKNKDDMYEMADLIFKLIANFTTSNDEENYLDASKSFMYDLLKKYIDTNFNSETYKLVNDIAIKTKYFNLLDNDIEKPDGVAYKLTNKGKAHYDYNYYSLATDVSLTEFKFFISNLPNKFDYKKNYYNYGTTSNKGAKKIPFSRYLYIIILAVSNSLETNDVNGYNNFVNEVYDYLNIEKVSGQSILLNDFTDEANLNISLKYLFEAVCLLFVLNNNHVTSKNKIKYKEKYLSDSSLKNYKSTFISRSQTLKDKLTHQYGSSFLDDIIKKHYRSVDTNTSTIIESIEKQIYMIDLARLKEDRNTSIKSLLEDYKANLDKLSYTDNQFVELYTLYRTALYHFYLAHYHTSRSKAQRENFKTALNLYIKLGQKMGYLKGDEILPAKKEEYTIKPDYIETKVGSKSGSSKGVFYHEMANCYWGICRSDVDKEAAINNANNMVKYEATALLYSNKKDGELNDFSVGLKDLGSAIEIRNSIINKSYLDKETFLLVEKFYLKAFQLADKKTYKLYHVLLSLYDKRINSRLYELSNKTTISAVNHTVGYSDFVKLWSFYNNDDEVNQLMDNIDYLLSNSPFALDSLTDKMAYIKWYLFYLRNKLMINHDDVVSSNEFDKYLLFYQLETNDNDKRIQTMLQNTKYRKTTLEQN